MLAPHTAAGRIQHEGKLPKVSPKIGSRKDVLPILVISQRAWDFCPRLVPTWQSADQNSISQRKKEISVVRFDTDHSLVIIDASPFENFKGDI